MTLKIHAYACWFWLVVIGLFLAPAFLLQVAGFAESGPLRFLGRTVALILTICLFARLIALDDSDCQ